MKTSFKNEFNTFEDDFNIEETTINEDIGIDPQKIRTAVLAQISEGKNKKKKRHKNITFIFIAAALTTAIVGTTAAAVALNKKDDFSEVISGESDALDVHLNDSFHFETTDDNLKAEFLGVKGTEEKAYALIELSTKDGSSFIGDYDGFINPKFCSFDSEEEYNDYLERNKKDLEKISNDLKAYSEYEPLDNSIYEEEIYLRDQENGNGGVFITNDNTDVSNIYQKVSYVRGETPDKIKVFFDLGNTSLLGTTVELKSEFLYFYHLSNDVVYEEEYINTITDIETANIKNSLEDIKKRFEKKGLNLDSKFSVWTPDFSVGTPEEEDYIKYDLQTIDGAKVAVEIHKDYTLDRIYYPDNDSKFKGVYPYFWDTSNRIYKLHGVDYVKKQLLPFKASFTIDELSPDKKNILELNSENAPNTLKNDEKIIITLSTFGASIYTNKDKYDRDGINHDNGNNFAEIILKNGNKYYFDLFDTEYHMLDYDKIKIYHKYSDYCYNNTSLTDVELLKKYVYDYSPFVYDYSPLNQTIVIDPTNIDKIIINGDTVYKA